MGMPYDAERVKELREQVEQARQDAAEALVEAELARITSDGAE